MTTIISGAWGPNASWYVDNFTSSFEQLWPADVHALYYFGSASKWRPPLCDQIGPRQLLDQGWVDFVGRHAGSAKANGREVLPTWKPQAKADGYYFKFDAVKFAGQAFIPAVAAHELPDGELMVWLDSDVRPFKPVPAGFLESLVPPTADGAYLGRSKYSEIGYWAVRLNERTRWFIENFRAAYVTDLVFDLPEWHSAYVWDAARKAAERFVNLRMHNLTPGGHGHVWFQSPLGIYLDHLKGKRKAAGRSPERR